MIQHAAALTILFLQGSDANAPSWDEVRSRLQGRIQGKDLADRLKALQETVATGDQRAFELLAQTLKWIRAVKNGPKDESEALRKDLNRLRESRAADSNERQRLLAKKQKSSSDIQRVQELNQSISSLDKKIAETRKQSDAAGASLANLDQMEAAVPAHAGALLGHSAAGLFESYRKALAKAFDFPGDLSLAPLYADILIRSGRKQAFPTLEGILKEAKGSEALFKTCANGMVALSSGEAIPSLIRLLAFPNASVRAAAHEALKAATQQNLPLDAADWERWYREKK